ncbi:probable apyrase 6 [Typha angustifolia]|uniref:probable apyrase 6 n=1 Tax=Typha angustifolia TaxID=59011 RepID=UPI003C2C133E
MRRPNARPQSPDSATATTEMDSPKPHRRPPPSSRVSFLSRISSSGPKRRHGGILLLLAAAAAVALFFIFSRILISPRFGIVIDGGSTGTRIHVFGYRAGWGSVPVIDLEVTSSMKATPGLSKYTEDVDGAGKSLVGLLEFAKGRVPRDRWGETEVRLMATGGLRLLEAGVVERILESCRKVLRGSGFRFRDDWASVISGTDEGIFAWVAANYALGTLGSDPPKTSGIMELGGASAQVTFVTNEHLPPEFSHLLKLGDVTYNLYSHSFLHLGQNVAYESLHELLSSRDLKSSAESLQAAVYRDPCTPRGFLHGSKPLKLSAAVLKSKTGYSTTALAVGNFSECRLAAFALLQKGKENCIYHHCHLGSTFMPKLQGRFLATENFFHTSKFLGLGPSAFLSDLILAGEQFCNDDWVKLKKKYHSLDEEELLLYCFSSAYIVALLHDSLGVSIEDKRISFANQVGGVPLDWALGAFIMQKSLNQSLEYSDWFIGVISYDSSALFSLFVVPSVLIFMAWSILKWKRPHFRTIYDLEKGRYILTRVNR